MLTVKQCPYTGPYSNGGTKLPSVGPTVKALKRAMARLGYMEWKGTEFTQAWPRDGALDKAFREWQKDREMPADGVYGEQEWKVLRYEKLHEGPNAGEHALDAYSCKRIREDWASQNVPDEADFRAQLTAYCLKAEANERNWHYVQYRPVDVTVEPNAAYARADCSSFAGIIAYHWAMTKSGLKVPDPTGYNWTGYGNTDNLDNHPRVGEPYKVGDFANYSGHVTVCRKGGTATSAVFTSHGSEAGPIPTSLHYRSDFRFVTRPPLK